MNIAVVDTNGELVQFERMEGAQIASGSISIGKARTAARFRRESRTFYNAFETGHGYVSTLDPTLVASPGGFPLVEGGKLIGAVGCSGGTGDQDAAVCKVGTEVVNSSAIDANVSRTRRSALTLLRRAGIHADTRSVGPGSAAHRHSVSKTRVNALKGAAQHPGHAVSS
jgi:uncharacterized protein GlcG (DUF336 family)